MADLKHYRLNWHNIYIYGTFSPITKGYTFFSNSNGTFSRIDYMLVYIKNLNKLKKIKIKPSISSKDNEMKLEISDSRPPQKKGKFTSTWKLINTLFNNN